MRASGCNAADSAGAARQGGVHAAGNTERRRRRMGYDGGANASRCPLSGRGLRATPGHRTRAVRPTERLGALQAVVPWVPRRVNATLFEATIGNRLQVVVDAAHAATPGVATVTVTPFEPTRVANPPRPKSTAVRLPSVVASLAARYSRPDMQFATGTIGSVRPASAGGAGSASSRGSRTNHRRGGLCYALNGLLCSCCASWPSRSAGWRRSSASSRCSAATLRSASCRRRRRPSRRRRPWST